MFEVGDGHGAPLYYATEPSEPIQTRVFLSHAASGANRDKITLWVVVAVCVLSALFLIGLIATLIVLTLIKYKPSKFHKAAQIVGSSGAPGPNKLGNNILNGAGVGGINGLIRSKFDRADDFLGIYKRIKRDFIDFHS